MSKNISIENYSFFKFVFHLRFRFNFTRKQFCCKSPFLLFKGYQQIQISYLQRGKYKVDISFYKLILSLVSYVKWCTRKNKDFFLIKFIWAKLVGRNENCPVPAPLKDAHIYVYLIKLYKLGIHIYIKLLYIPKTWINCNQYVYTSSSQRSYFKTFF